MRPPRCDSAVGWEDGNTDASLTRNTGKPKALEIFKSPTVPSSAPRFKPMVPTKSSQSYFEIWAFKVIWMLFSRHNKCFTPSPEIFLSGKLSAWFITEFHGPIISHSRFYFLSHSLQLDNRYIYRSHQPWYQYWLEYSRTKHSVLRQPFALFKRATSFIALRIKKLPTTFCLIL